MGGSRCPQTNLASNGVLLCAGCHRLIESRRADALELGWLVRQGVDPAGVPVLWRGTDWVLLTSDGGMVPVEDSAA